MNEHVHPIFRQILDASFPAPGLYDVRVAFADGREEVVSVGAWTRAEACKEAQRLIKDVVSAVVERALLAPGETREFTAEQFAALKP